MDRGRIRIYRKAQAVALATIVLLTAASPALGQDIALPIATTHPASNVSVASGVGSAILHGYANLFGPGNYLFEYGPQSVGFLYQTAPVFINGATQFSALVSNLQANTTYLFRAVGVNNYGITYGQTLSFFTASTGGSGGGEQPTLPLVRTDSGSSSPGSNSAVFNGYVNPFGQTATVLFRYGTAPGSLVNQTISEERSTNGFFSAIVTGLAQNTTYYFEAVAITDLGTVSGGVRSVFIFPPSSTGGGQGPAQPIVRTDSGTSMPGSSGAIFNGYVNPFGAEMTTYFEYGTSPDALVNQTVSEVRTGNGFISATVSGLTTNTTYFFQAVGITTDGTTRGGVRSVFVPGAGGTGGGQGPAQPIVRTDPGSSNPGSGTATLNAYINPFGESLNVFFEYGTTAGTLTSQTTPEVRSGSGFFSKLVSGLTMNTTYFFRAVGVNTTGNRTEGGVLSVFVPASGGSGSSNQTLAIIRTDPASISGGGSAMLRGYYNSFGDSMTVYFKYGTAPGTLASQTATQTISGNGFFEETLSGLTPGTTYYYAAVGVTSQGTIEGSTVRFVP